MKAKSKDTYGPLESENVTVGTVNAASPEAREDEHGMAALRKKRAKGGKVTGEAPKMRLDRRARGGKVSGKGVKINVIVAPQGGGAPPIGGPGPMMPPSGAPPMPPRPMPPMGAPAPTPMAGPGPMRKDGGRVSQPVPRMTASAANGEGAKQKIKAYGKKAYGADC